MNKRKARLTGPEEITRQSYDQGAAAWSSSHSVPKFWGEDFDKFFELLPTGSRLLEVGCGGGRDARELIAFGYDYTGTDISAGQLEQARQNNPGALFEQVSVYDLDFDKPFDGFWCAAALLHIPKGRISEALAAVRRNMVVGAIGYISLKEGHDQQIEHNKELGDRFFAYWQREEFNDVLLHNKFEILHEGYMPFERTKWLTYHLRV